MRVEQRMYRGKKQGPLTVVVHRQGEVDRAIVAAWFMKIDLISKIVYTALLQSTVRRSKIPNIYPSSPKRFPQNVVSHEYSPTHAIFPISRFLHINTFARDIVII